jgi:hypothetical protein
MWEMEGRSTAEIAAELGIKESAVRHTVSRARASLRKVMSELIVDKERGLTALDMLSTTYKKAAQIAKKSSKAALSLILVFFAFLGFNAMPTDSELPNIVAQESISTNEGQEPTTSQSATPAAKPAPTKSVDTAAQKSAKSEVNAKAKSFSFTGLDEKGIPTGFTITDSNGALGSLYTTKRPALLTETELTISQVSKTDTGAANIFLSQQLITDYAGFRFLPNLSYGKDGSWVPLVTQLSYLDVERMIDGNYLVTAIIKVESEVETSVAIPASASGRDLLQAPRQVITRIVLNPGKTQILAQAIQVIERVGK